MRNLALASISIAALAIAALAGSLTVQQGAEAQEGFLPSTSTSPSSQTYCEATYIWDAYAQANSGFTMTCTSR